MARLGGLSHVLAARADELDVVPAPTPEPALAAVPSRTEEEARQEPAAPETPEPEVAAEKVDPEPEPVKQERPAVVKAAPEPKAEKKPRAAAKRKARQSEPEPEPEPAPAERQRAHYTELIRKELRLHPAQSADLTMLTVKIHNAKRGRGERITDNTLMRIALDLLLERKAELKGTTEDELRASVGLPPVVYEED